jgi:hypothetical protein
VVVCLLNNGERMIATGSAGDVRQLPVSYAECCVPISPIDLALSPDALSGISAEDFAKVMSRPIAATTLNAKLLPARTR